VYNKLMVEGSYVAKEMEYTVHSCPSSLLRNFVDVFVELKNQNCSELLVVVVWQPTTNSMANYYRETELEREEKAAKFIEWASNICSRLQEKGHWADFVDPLTGEPHLGKKGGSIFIDTEAGIHLFGFSVLDVGCCKVLEHPVLKTKAFPSVLCTLAPRHLFVEALGERGGQGGEVQSKTIDKIKT